MKISKLREIQLGYKEKDSDNYTIYFKKLGGYLTSDIHIFKNTIKEKNKESLFMELSTLIEAGLDLRNALRIIYDQKDAKQSYFIKEIEDSLINGYSLSESIKKVGKFSNYDYYSIKIGEETGNLTKVLKVLSTYYRFRLNNKRQIIGALTYPLLVLLTAFISVLFMMKFMIPMFADIFKRFDGNLPHITEIVIGISQLINGHLIYISITIILIIIIFRILKKNSYFQKIYSIIILKFPMINKMIRKYYSMQFTQTMALLMLSEVPFVQAIDLVHNMTDFYLIKKALIKIKYHIIRGGSLSTALMETRFFEQKVIKMTKVGEEVNKLGEVYSKLSRNYAEEIEHEIKTLNNLLEPFLIIVVGTIVGIILISMYLPMFKFGTIIR